MRLSRSNEWLDKLLSGFVPKEPDLRQIVEDCPEEDQYLEFKAGKELEKKDAPGTLREYTAAFANSDGGVLMVGYDQAAKAFDGAVAPGGGPLDVWATRALYPLTPYLSPPPRIRVSEVDDNRVLVMATARAPRLVPLTSKGDIVYWLRINDSNFPAPPYLLSDLVLGRRNHPVLHVELASATAAPIADTDCLNVTGLQLSLAVTIENTSLAFAEDVRCGLISWAVQVKQPEVGAEVAPSLRANLAVQAPPHYRPQSRQPRWHLTHVRLQRDAIPSMAAPQPALDIGPFDRTPPQPLHNLVLPAFPNHLQHAPPPDGEDSPLRTWIQETRIQMRGAVRLRSALYVLSKNAEPRWYQLLLRYEERTAYSTDLTHHIHLVPARLRRPRVSAGFYAPAGETI